MLEITAQLAIPDEEIHLEFIRAGGPGGQNVNKVAHPALQNSPTNSTPVHMAGETTQPRP